MKRIRGVVKNNVVELPEGIRLSDGTEVDVVVPSRRDRRHAAIQRVLNNPITHPVGMAEMMEEAKRERERHGLPKDETSP
jgi:hypothetical protein